MMSPLQSSKQFNTLPLMLQTVSILHNRSHRKRRQQSFDDDDDENDGRLEEGLERGVRQEHFFEKVLKDNEANFMQVRIELKNVPRLETKYLPWILTFSLPPLFLRSRNLRTILVSMHYMSSFSIFLLLYSIKQNYILVVSEVKFTYSSHLDGMTLILQRCYICNFPFKVTQKIMEI